MRRILVLALIALPSFAYNLNTVTTGGQVYTQKRIDNTGITFLLNDSVASKPIFTAGSNVAAAAQAALASWNAVTTANIHFNTLGTTALGHDHDDCKHVILVASSAIDTLAVGGAIAVTIPISTVSGSACNGTLNPPPGTIIDSDIIFNPSFTFSTDNTANTHDFQSVLTHELGHALGANHSSLLGATMFPSAAVNQLNPRYLTSDDIAFASALYPAANFTPGILSGKISTSGGSAVKFGLITAIDRTIGTSYCAITGADGNYSINVPVGTYIVYAEPFNSFISSGSIYAETSTGVLDPTQVTTGFLPTFLGTSGSPTTTAVTSGKTSVVSITVTSGTSTLTTPAYSLATAGGSGGISTLSSLGGAVSLTSGSSIDFAVGTGGIDANTTFLVFGRGISVKAGSVRSDPKLNLGKDQAGNDQPLMRVTLDIPSQTDNTLATLWIVKGTNIMALSGGLFISPPGGPSTAIPTTPPTTPKPTFTANGFVNAASYGGNGTVSPGGLSSLYDTTNLSIGPTNAAINTTYDINGKLATTAGGVSITFNDIAAPIYFSYAGQINFQVPFELAGLATAQAVVTYNGVSSAPVTVNVVQTQPTFFTATPQGKDALIHNFPDYTLNKANNAAARGSVVILYGTGIGKLSYPLATGQPGVVPPVNYVSTFTCTFGGQTTSAYAYWNYGFVGEATWTVTVPANTPTGAVDLTCKDGNGAVTPAGTIYIK